MHAGRHLNIVLCCADLDEYGWLLRDVRVRKTNIFKKKILKRCIIFVCNREK